MATSDVSILRKAGVVTPKNLAIYTRGREGDAQRMEARARRDIAHFQRQPDNPNAPYIIKGLERRLVVASKIRAEVRAVQEAYKRRQALMARTQQ